MDVISVKHSYAGGDLISILPGLRHVFFKSGKKWVIYQQIDFKSDYYEEAVCVTFDAAGNGVTMNRTNFEMMKPLIEAQDYIEEFKEWKGETVDIDIDKTRFTRSIPIPLSPLHHWPFFIAPELSCDLSQKWLNVPYETVPNGNIIINRTERYNNPYIHYHFLKQYEKDLLFTGTKKEHKTFCDKWNLYIPYLDVSNFLELAASIQNCRFFLGSQSMCWHIADALKVKRILEFCAVFPNTFPNGADGYAFASQESLELLFHNLYQKTSLT